jgi:putative adenylate-forming enzyme
VLLKIRILLSYLRHRHFLKFKTREALERFQESKIKRHLKFLKKRSPYFKKQLENLGARSWRELPLMDKKTMMSDFDSLNTVGVKQEEAFRVAVESEQTRDFSPTIGEITVGLSSGTSGNRGIFLVSPRERANHAGSILAKILPGSLFSGWKVAFFLRANSNLYTTSQSRKLAFHFFDLLDGLDRHVDRLNQLHPDLLIGPPSLLRRLASEAEAGRLRIKPRKVVSVAEVLDPLDRKLIEKAFGQVTHQVYQCTEGFLGITCERGVLHLNEDLVHVEPRWLDDSKTRFNPVITDFSRTSQPIIRYVLNDILTVKKEPCECGSVFLALEEIEGRSDDCLEFFTLSGKLAEVYPDFIRRCILFAGDEVTEYHVTQRTPGEIAIALKLGDPRKLPEVQNAIRQSFAEFTASRELKVPEIKFHSDFPVLGLRKLRRVERVRLSN